MRQCSNLNKFQQTQFIDLEKDGNRLKKSVRIQRTKFEESWTAYEKALLIREAAEAANKPSKVDPLIACRVYQREAVALAKVQFEGEAQMQALATRISQEDQDRMTALRTIMLESLLAQKTVLENLRKFNEASIQAAMAIDVDRDAAEFAASLVAPSKVLTRQVKGIHSNLSDSPSLSPSQSPKLGSAFALSSLFSLGISEPSITPPSSSPASPAVGLLPPPPFSTPLAFKTL